MKIVVLAGGLSPERDVSLASGALISNALMEKGHDVMLLDLYLGVKNRDLAPVYQNQKTGVGFSYDVPEREPDLQAVRRAADNGGRHIGDGVLELCRAADRVFLALHGSIGENGQLQAVLDVHGVSYTGTGYVGSLLAMDKDLSKRLLRSHGVLTPDWRVVNPRSDSSWDGFPCPCVVKPCGCGSSVGVSMVDHPEELKRALACAGQYEDRVLIEEKIEGREFSVGVLGGRPLPVIEIKPLSGFYDYRNKYQAGLTEEICPARVPEDVRALLWDAALKVHQLLRLGFYSRVDFILDQNNRAYCLEANTLPGMTPTSLLPQEARAAGLSYEDLCEMIALAP